MTELEQIQQDIIALKKRNRKVEADKAWETSLMRKGLIAILTYAVVVLFFYVANFERPFINAIIPTMGFILSTLSVPIVKKIWLERKGENE